MRTIQRHTSRLLALVACGSAILCACAPVTRQVGANPPPTLTAPRTEPPAPTQSTAPGQPTAPEAPSPSLPASGPAGGPEPGVCDGAICGPSGAFTVRDFPNIAGVDFAAFPPNPARPYLPHAGSRTWYVAPNGDDAAGGAQASPLQSINRAVEAAQAGDVILVADGEYRIGMDESAGLDLRVPELTLAAEHPGRVVLRPANESVITGIVAEADNLIVDGFVIEGFVRGYSVLFGREASPQRNLVLKHLVIDGSSDGLRSVVPATQPNPQPLIRGLLLYDVWIRNVGVVGFNCGEGPCVDLRLEALRVQMPGSGSGSGADAVAVEEGENIVVFNADISGAAADGLDFKSARVATANVVVHDLARNGIKFWRGGDVINALVYNTGADAAVVFDRGARYRLLNTVVAYHSRGESAYAATVAYDQSEQPGQLQVINTIFFQNSGALWVSPAFKLDVRNSIFFGAPEGEVTWGDLTVGEGFESFAELEKLGGGCCNLGVVDPRFTNPEQRDYRLSVASPALNAGTSQVEAFPAFDLFGAARVAGSSVDLGPIEMP
jgi:hypothetical protein